MLYVIKHGETEEHGPAPWHLIREDAGLAGNKNPPKTPFDLGNGRSLEAHVPELPPDPDPVIPTAVTPLQARKALIAANLLDTVETWIANQAVAVQVAWEYASVVERDDPAIAAAATALEMTDAEVDALFIAAAQM